MHCADVTRELAVPTGTLDPNGLARHLESCSACAGEAEKARLLDQVWDATRPAEPADEVWDEVWSGVTQAADATHLASPATIPLKPALERQGSPRRVSWLGILAVAQAAALLVAVGLLIRRGQAEGPAVAATPAPPSASFAFKLDPGQTVFLELDEQGGQIVCRPNFVDTRELVAYDPDDADSSMLALDAQAFDMQLLNGMESIQ